MKIDKILGNIARNNYSIAAKLLVDKNAHLPRATVYFEEREFMIRCYYITLYMNLIMSYQCLLLCNGYDPQKN
ncbi:hypothetical protein RhiirC2_799430 [Rhizophagus irregularis]|uniref:Uncharacterized protein n=1 Tax=Rhizophagus irregularis TaxID=588596 RepID=A0A2N1M538_9GLOM|nr:hypothetical protein RhiirC2_799430 [Rhizophagus irregularis]